VKESGEEEGANEEEEVEGRGRWRRQMDVGKWSKWGEG
jgi:hypothetical protein